MSTSSFLRRSLVASTLVISGLALAGCSASTTAEPTPTDSREAANLDVYECIANYSGQNVVVSRTSTVDGTSVTMKSGDVLCKDSAGGIVFADDEVYITFVDRSPVPQENVYFNNPWVGPPYIQINGQMYSLREGESGNVTVSDLNYGIKRSPDSAEYKNLTLTLLPS